MTPKSWSKMAFAVSKMRDSTVSTNAQTLRALTPSSRRNTRLINKVLSRKRRSVLREHTSKSDAHCQLDNDTVSDDELKQLRLTINQRERRRMQDLNSAMNELRSVLPSSSGPSVKRLSKITTLLHARNYILFLCKTLSQLASESLTQNYQSPNQSLFNSIPSKNLHIHSCFDKVITDEHIQSQSCLSPTSGSPGNSCLSFTERIALRDLTVTKGAPSSIQSTLHSPLHCITDHKPLMLDFGCGPLDFRVKKTKT